MQSIYSLHVAYIKGCRNIPNGSPITFLWVCMGRKLYQKTEFNDCHSMNKFCYLWYSEYNKNIQKLNFSILAELCQLFFMSIRQWHFHQCLFPPKHITWFSGYVFINTTFSLTERHYACWLIYVFNKVWSKLRLVILKHGAQ